MKHILAIALVVLITGSVMAQNNITQPLVKKIEVTGSAELEVVPDEIYIAVTLKEYYNKQKEKLNIGDISKSFLKSCEAAGIAKDRIEVLDMSGYDNTRWWDKRNKNTPPDLLQSAGYVIKFTSPADVDKLTALLDDNATQMVSINRVTNSKQAEYRKQLKIQALQNAKAKAQYLLESVGEKMGGLLYVNESQQEPFMPYYERAMLSNSRMADDSGSANEGLNFRKIKYRFDMVAHFAIQ